MFMLDKFIVMQKGNRKLLWLLLFLSSIIFVIKI